jgi:hypothetical protein
MQSEAERIAAGLLEGRIFHAAFASAEAVRLASQQQHDEALPTFQHPCGRRTVIVGRWGHQLAHQNDCPDCVRLAEQTRNT